MDVSDETRETCEPVAWWQRPFDGLTLALTAMISGALLWNALFPSFYYMVFIFWVGAFWAGIGVVLCVRLFLAGMGRRLTDRPVIWVGWRGVTAWMVVVSVAVLLKLPLRVGFALARADLERAVAQDQRPGETFSLTRSQYGIYGIRQQAQRRCHRDDRIYFTLANDDEAGFVHSTSGIEDLWLQPRQQGAPRGQLVLDGRRLILAAHRALSRRRTDPGAARLPRYGQPRYGHDRRRVRRCRN